MIDDYEKAMELVEEMKAHLPIPSSPSIGRIPRATTAMHFYQWF